MSQDLVVHKENPLLSTELAELGRKALEAHDRVCKCAAEAVENMVRAGQLLCKARDLCDAHPFEQFIVNHFRGKRRTAQTYMKLARNWHMLETAAPAEALTSQRKALRALDRLLTASQTQSEGTARRKKRPSTATPELAAPTNDSVSATLSGSAAAPADVADEERQVAVRGMYQEVLRLLAELTKELLQVTPQHYAVEYALHLIRRTRSQFEQNGRTLFDG